MLPEEIDRTEVRCMICSHCSLEMEPGQLYCRGCRKLQAMDAQDLPPLEEGDRLLSLVEACETVGMGVTSLAEFRTFITEFAAEQRRREMNIHEATDDLPVDLDCEFAEERQVGFQGVEAVNHSLEILEHWDPDEDATSQAMLEALSLFGQGVLKVREAMRINRSKVDRPLWL